MKNRANKLIKEAKATWSRYDRFSAACLVLQAVFGLGSVALAYGLIK